MTQNSPTYNMLNTFGVTGITFTGSSNIPYVNGVAQSAKATFTPSSWNNFIIGCQSNAIQAWYGDIAEILVFNTNLNTNARQTIEGYLAWKWGVQASLPTSHPYYTIKPNFSAPIV